MWVGLIAVLSTSGVLARGRPAWSTRRSELLPRALKGTLSWRDYLRRFRRASPSVFEDRRLRAGSPDKFRILVEDRQDGFAILRDRKGLRPVEQDRRVEAEHLLGIPIGRRQPTWIVGGRATRIGRITRETLDAPRALHRREEQTLVYYHLPTNVSQSIVHAHGVWRPAGRPRVKSWRSFVRRGYQELPRKQHRSRNMGGDYRLFLARPDARRLAAEWPVLAIASAGAGTPATMDRRTDRLLGRMILDVARASLELAPRDALRAGRIEVDRADSRIVVRLVRRRQPSDVLYW